MTGLGQILTAIVTPFDAEGRVEEESFVALMAHLAENGSDGFVVAGTTGEASTLTDEEQLGLIELAVRERPPGTTIIAGAGTNDTRHAVHLTERATELGADALLSVTPYYNRPSRLGLKRHYEAVAKATDKPILLYNIPAERGRTCPRSARGARADRRYRGRQAGQSSGAAADRRPRPLRRRRRDVRAHARHGWRGRHPRRKPRRRQRDARMVDEPEHRAEIDASLRTCMRRCS
jgi:4-hydroxy-tetrahydrodipicolinate synthase